MPYLYDGKIIREGRGWRDKNGVQHPATWATAWTDSEKSSWGLVWQEPPKSFDPRFYYADGAPKPLDDKPAVDSNGAPVLYDSGQPAINKGLRSQAIQNVKRQAIQLLSDTDWMIIKSVENRKYTVPADILQYRSDVRTTSNVIEAAIKGAATLDDFKALFNRPVDAQGQPTAKAPISNWPDPPAYLPGFDRIT